MSAESSCFLPVARSFGNGALVLVAETISAFAPATRELLISRADYFVSSESATFIGRKRQRRATAAVIGFDRGRTADTLHFVEAPLVSCLSIR